MGVLESGTLLVLFPGDLDVLMQDFPECMPRSTRNWNGLRPILRKVARVHVMVATQIQLRVLQRVATQIQLRVLPRVATQILLKVPQRAQLRVAVCPDGLVTCIAMTKTIMKSVSGMAVTVAKAVPPWMAGMTIAMNVNA